MIVRDEHRQSVLRNMTKQNWIVVTQRYLMRSFDYRCPDGIALFIGKQLESRRDIR